MVYRAHKIRLKPTKAQAEQLRKLVGVCRYAYNWGLDLWNDLYSKNLPRSGYLISNAWTKLRPSWSREVSDYAQRKVFINLQHAWKTSFSHLNEKPTYHKRYKHDRAYFGNTRMQVRERRIRLERIGWVRMYESFRYPDAKIVSGVVSCRAGQWFIAIKCEIDEDRRTESTSVVGVDVGIKHWAVASDGTALDSPAKLKHLQRELKRKQRLADRKKKGSQNRKKAYLKVSKLYKRIDNIKKDAIHKFTSTISKNHGVVVLEDLCIEGMKRGVKSVRKGAQNSAMGEIHRQLMYKCNNYIEVNRFYPSSKTCSHCGNIQATLSLDDRTYQCHACGMTIDRDLNASINLLNEGLRKLSTVGHTVKDCGASPKDLK